MVDVGMTTTTTTTTAEVDDATIDVGPTACVDGVAMADTVGVVSEDVETPVSSDVTHKDVADIVSGNDVTHKDVVSALHDGKAILKACDTVEETESVIDPRLISRHEKDENEGHGMRKAYISKAQRKATKLEKTVLEADALRGYESFYQLSQGVATLQQVVKSSAGVQGWALFARAQDVVSKDQAEDEEALNRHIATDKLLEGLGVFEEIASKRRKQVRFEDKHVARTASRSLCETFTPVEDIAVLNSEVWTDVEFEVALD